MSTTKKQVRKYHRITPEQMSSFEALQALLGNGSAAVRALTPAVRNPSNRAFRIRRKAKAESSELFIDNQLQAIGIDAINRIGEVVASPDEKTALKASTYVIDHIRGQATKKSIALVGKANIQNLLD